jgi:hypothetical protein
MSVSAHCVTFSLPFSLTGAYYAVKNIADCWGCVLPKTPFPKYRLKNSIRQLHDWLLDFYLD